MIRSFVVCGAMLFLACTTVPEGQCEDSSGCLAGLRCEEGICTGCGGDDQCQPWEGCTEERRCKPRPGMCRTSAQCQAWEVCGASYTCQLAAGFCLGAADCQPYEDCEASSKTCVLQAGRCTGDEHCASGYLWTATCGAENRCRSEPPADNDLLLWGTLSEGLCGNDAISSILTPTRVQVGFDCYHSIDQRSLLPDGRIVYRDGAKEPVRLRVFAADVFRVEGTSRRYPANTGANDTVLPAPGCGAGDDVIGFVVQAGTGAIAYSCRATGPSTFYDASGKLIAPERWLLSWNASNHLLARGDFAQLFVVTPERRSVPVSGLPDGALLMDVRAASAGFRAAVTSSFDFNVQQLWLIGNDGAATLEGAYGAFPEGVQRGQGGVLDAAGALYSKTQTLGDSSDDVVVRRVADGSTGTVIYTEASAPARVNASSNYTQLFNLMHGSTLFGGP